MSHGTVSISFEPLLELSPTYEMLLLPNTGVNKPSGVVNFKGNKYELEILLFLKGFEFVAALIIKRISWKCYYFKRGHFSDKYFSIILFHVLKYCHMQMQDPTIQTLIPKLFIGGKGTNFVPLSVKQILFDLKPKE